MMTRTRKIALAGLVLLLGGAVGADWLLGRAAEALLARLQASLPAGASFTHGALSTNIFRMSVSLDDVDYRSPQLSFRAQRALLHGFPHVSPTKLSLGGVELRDAAILNPGAFEASVAQLVVTDPVLYPPRNADAPPSLTFSSFTGDHLATKKEAGGISLSLTAFRLSDLDAGALARLDVQGLQATAPDTRGVLTRVVLDRATVEGFDLALLKEGSALGVLRRLLLLNSLKGAVVEGFRLEQGEAAGLTLKRFSFDGHDVEGQARTALGVLLEGLTISPPLLPPDMKAQVAALGRTGLDIQGEFRARTDTQQKTLTLEPVTVTLPGLASLSLQGRLGRVENTASLASGLLAAVATLERVELHVRDLGGVARYVRFRAEQEKISPQTYASSLAAQLMGEESSAPAVQKSGAPSAPPLTTLDFARRDLISFLQNGGDFVVVAQPTAPVSLLQLFLSAKNKGILVDKLGLSVKTILPDAKKVW